MESMYITTVESIEKFRRGIKNGLIRQIILNGNGKTELIAVENIPNGAMLKVMGAYSDGDTTYGWSSFLEKRNGIITIR